MAGRGVPGAGGHQQPRSMRLFAATDQNPRKDDAYVSASHASLRAVAHGAGHRHDIGSNHHAGNRGDQPLSPGGNSASYCRCVDSTQISNGKRNGTGNVKNGHPYLAWAYMEAAQCALRFQPGAQRFDQHKLAQSRNNTVLARKAVAHKLARACYDIMRDLVPFEATQAFG